MASLATEKEIGNTTDGKGNNVTADSLDSGVNELTALLNKHTNHIELLKTKVAY